MSNASLRILSTLVDAVDALQEAMLFENSDALQRSDELLDKCRDALAFEEALADETE